MNDMSRHALPRYVATALTERLKAMPAVVVTGARQTGKTTLVRQFGPAERLYRSFDDLDVIEIGEHDPDALVGGSLPTTLDEIQRAPAILHDVKRAIDQNRRSGQFLLTGSANLLLMRTVSESLAGRASYLTLWPMTRREQLGRGSCGRWGELFSTSESEWLGLLRSNDDLREDWRALALRGGFPTPAVEMTSQSDRSIWFDGYVRTYLERDLQQLASISSLPDFRRLARAASLRVGQVANQTEIGRDVAIPQPTVHRYLNLLETSYLLVRIPAFSVNRTKRLIKSPKIYWGDVGLALHLAGIEHPGGAHLENIVLADLLCWRDATSVTTGIHYWRTTTGEEVDFVVESAGALMPIEVKSSGRPRLSDARSLRVFRDEYRDQCRAGLLLHDGDTFEWLTPGVLAVPWWSVV